MKTIKIIIYVLGGLLVLSVGFFLVSYAVTSLETMSAQTAQSRLQELRRTEKTLGGTSKEWTEIDNTYSAFKEDYLMKSVTLDRFKQDLQMLSRKNRLGNARFNYKFKFIFSDVVQISVNVEMAGSYENIKRFIFDIENFKAADKLKMVLLKKVELNKKITSNIVEAELAMEVYFVK